MSVRISLPRNAPRDAFFKDMPPEAREFLKSGFAQLVTFPPESLTNVASQVIRWLDPTDPAPEIDVLARELKVDQQTMNAIMAAVTVQATALFAGMYRMPLDMFVKNAINAGILESDHANAVKDFSHNYIETRSAAFADALARANSSTEIVPSFQDLDTTIDLRVAVVNDQRVVTVPMVIATLRTDVRDQKLIFQMTPRDVGQLLQQLEAITKQLDRSKGLTDQSVSRR